MVRVLFVLIPLVAAFWVFTIVDCAIQPPTRHRGVRKGAWIAIVILIPVLGGILWLAVGRVRKSAVTVYQAPDDDPEFLSTLSGVTDQDERIRRLEEELAKLDSEDDDPRGQTARDATDAADAPSSPDSDTAPGGSASGGPSANDATGSADDDDTRGQRGAHG
ncbi:PLD nuclease N-terminal domain-containing protein [Microbacterium koreense]|uniref:PLD nuclease N-terminal domain-containing protein n=1 Tax=Microbacterium koreense TaxID=323761 RepID=A0ABW2ZPR6_9MICO